MDKELMLKQQILDELEWEPSVDAAHIGVAVTGNVATLTGSVASYMEKIAAERAVKRIAGVHGVANDIEVRPLITVTRNDTEIASAAVNALQWNIQVPHDGVKVRVAGGWVTLEGTVPFHFQKDAAEGTVRHLIGVRGVTSLVTVTPPVQPTDVKTRIEAAFRRNAELEAHGIQVAAVNGRVTLTGKVHTWAERDEAERAAWAAPGVTQVQDELRVAV